MLFRASHHFYPTLSETLDLQGFLRPVLQVFFRIFWQIVFFGVFLCLGDFFHIFQAFWGFFHFLLEFCFSFLFAHFHYSIIIISSPDNVKQRFPNQINIEHDWKEHSDYLGWHLDSDPAINPNLRFLSRCFQNLFVIHYKMIHDFWDPQNAEKSVGIIASKSFDALS